MRQASDGSYYRQDSEGEWHEVEGPKTRAEAIQLGLADQTLGENLVGHARSLAGGAMLNWGDEAEAAIGAAGDKLAGAVSGQPVNYGDRYGARRDDIRGQMAAHAHANPNANLATQMGGGLAAGVASAPLLAGKGIMGLTGMGAAQGGMAGAGNSQTMAEAPMDTVGGAALGGALGAAAKPVSHAVGKVVQSPFVAGNVNRMLPESLQIPVAGSVERSLARVPENYQQSAATADRLGFQLTPYQRTQDPTLGQLEAVMKSKTGSVGPFDAIADQNQALLNRTIAKTLDQHADRVDLKQAAARTRELFDAAAASGEKVPLSEATFAQSRGAIDDYFAGIGRPDRTPAILEGIERAAQKGEMDAGQWQSTFSKLGKNMEAARHSDPDLSNVYRTLRDDMLSAIDDAAPETSQILKAARQLHKNRMPLERPNVVNAATGDVRMGSLHTNYRRDVPGYVRGGNTSDAYELSRLYDAYGKDAIGNSGTATRSQSLIDHIGFSKGREAAAKSYLGQDAYRRGSLLLSPSTLNLAPGQGAAITGGSSLLTDDDIREMYRRR